jgi:hypothetical protein
MEAIKKFIYKHLTTGSHRMWNMKYFVTPVIIMATEIFNKELKNYLEVIPGKHSTESLKKHT